MKNTTMFNSGYFADMQIVDERLTKLEEGYAKIIKLLNDMTNDLSKIEGNGGKRGIKKTKEQNAKQNSKR